VLKGDATIELTRSHNTDESDSFLRKFEAEIAEEFGKEDAVFMPSGVMAQSIALLIHGGKQKRNFACHHSSHLLIHEQDAYRELIGMEPLVIDTRHKAVDCSVPPMTFQDVQEAFGRFAESSQDGTETKVGKSLSTLILELPHRELGGKCTPWEDIEQMRQLCNDQGVQFHCDGARIFEASCYYSDKNLAEIASIFDSFYISFYKGLGGISGAMLMGDAAFCEEARTWLRRFGGNLYTLLPYAVSGWTGYRRHWIDVEDNLSFVEKYAKLSRLVAAISEEKVVSFDPEIPDVNMVHGYFRHSVDDVLAARDKVEELTGYRVLNRVGTIPKEEPAYKNGYRSKFEWTMGAANGAVADQEFVKVWKALASKLE
jgi:threonine aldolase